MAIFAARGGGRGVLQEMMVEKVATVLRHNTRMPHAAVHSNETLPAGVKALRIIAYNLADAVRFIRRLRQEPSKCKEFVNVINAGRAEAEEEGFARRASGGPCCRRKVVLMAERLDLEGAQPALWL